MDDVFIIAALRHLGICLGQRLDEDRLNGYVEHLRDLKNENHLSKAVTLLVERESMFPSIALIRETYREVVASAPSSSLSIEQFTPMTPAERAALAVEMRSFIEEKWGGGIGPSTDPAGRCDDCHKDVRERWALGPGLFCRHCCTSRSKVKARLDISGLLRDMPVDTPTPVV